MANVLKTRLVKIGNSRGIRLPKPLLTAAGIESDVEVTVRDNELIIRPARNPREGWEDQFKLMAERGHDKLEDWSEYLPTKFDEEEWEW